MKNKLLSNSFRSIKNNIKRFLSLMCMALLGVGFFAGIQATPSDMLATLDEFYDNQQVYDIEVISTLGLTDDDIEELEKIDEIETAIGTYSQDVFADIGEEEYVVKMMGINDDINTVYLKEGNMPENDNEVLVEEAALEENLLEIGDIIIIDDKEYTITGTMISPLYLYSTRGSTSLGNGQIDYVIYVNEDVFEQDYYTEIYIKVTEAEEKTTSTDEYLELIDNAIQKIEDIQDNREDARYEEIYGEYIEYAKMTNIPIDESEFTKATWYIYDRTDNTGYEELVNAGTSIEKIGVVFPVVFYIIAILISLISMMRMVEEDRTENGTLKALRI